MFNKFPIPAILTALLLLATFTARSQSPIKPIPLPKAISGVNEELSGMCTWQNRVYLEPQYGDFKETKLDGQFYLYSLRLDSIGRVIDGKDTALSNYQTTRVLGLDKLPDSVKQYYEGFEALSIVNNRVYLSIETNDTYAYCFLLKGLLDTNRHTVTIDAKRFVTIRRYPNISNAGFESVTYLPNVHKLIAFYEFNALPNGGVGYLIDTAFKRPPEKIKAPFLYFRLTDLTATSDGRMYGINYFWNGDYDHYLNNDMVHNQDTKIATTIPNLRDSISQHPDYLKRKTFARIVTLKNIKATEWQQVVSFDGYKNNWEGLTLYRKGALIITDANRSSKQLSTFGYVAF